jgi:magnesium-transporting ATPase (P-type)
MDVGILKRFQFASALQRMTVIVKNHTTDAVEAYMKGSPEKLKTLCLANTSIKSYK